MEPIEKLDISSYIISSLHYHSVRNISCEAIKMYLKKNIFQILKIEGSDVSYIDTTDFKVVSLLQKMSCHRKKRTLSVFLSCVIEIRGQTLEEIYSQTKFC